jgi:hypothetical protein
MAKSTSSDSFAAARALRHMRMKTDSKITPDLLALGGLRE